MCFYFSTNGVRCAFVEAATLTQWLNDHQRDPRLNEILFPMYNDKSSKVLIRNYEPDPEMAKKGLTVELTLINSLTVSIIEVGSVSSIHHIFTMFNLE